MGHHAPHAAPDAIVTDEIVDEIATEVRADRKTVIRRLAGLPVRGRVGADIDRALAARRPHHAPSSPPNREA